MIERVKKNNWDPHNNSDDQDIKNALAARGYYEAFLQVKKTIEQIFESENSGEIIRDAHQEWYGALFICLYTSLHGW